MKTSCTYCHTEFEHGDDKVGCISTRELWEGYKNGPSAAAYYIVHPDSSGPHPDFDSGPLHQCHNGVASVANP